jgi:cytochrome c oxidase assembly factor CtaG
MDGYGVPAELQNLTWPIVFSCLFVFGAVTLVITARKTMKSYKDANDAMSADAVKHLIVGGAIASVLLIPGFFFGLVRMVAGMLGGFGLGS